MPKWDDLKQKRVATNNYGLRFKIDDVVSSHMKDGKQLVKVTDIRHHGDLCNLVLVR